MKNLKKWMIVIAGCLILSGCINSTDNVKKAGDKTQVVNPSFEEEGYDVGVSATYEEAIDIGWEEGQASTMDDMGYDSDYWSSEVYDEFATSTSSSTL